MKVEERNGCIVTTEVEDIYNGYEFIVLHNRYKESAYSKLFHTDMMINGWRCGYVCVQDFVNEMLSANDNINFEWFEERIDCHGGITFYDIFANGKLYIGFDCCHLEDTVEKCNTEFCINECKSIIDQLIKLL